MITRHTSPTPPLVSVSVSWAMSAGAGVGTAGRRGRDANGWCGGTLVCWSVGWLVLHPHKKILIFETNRV